MEEIQINIGTVEFVKLINLVVNEIRKDFDISKNILEQILSPQSKFMKMCYFLYCQTMNSVVQKEFESDNLAYNAERCQHIISTYDNGYIKFCNEHKYVHYLNESHKFQPFDDHNLKIYASQQSISVPYIQKQLIFVNKSYHLLYKYLISCSRKMTQSIENLSEINEWMKSNKFNYRDKNTYKTSDSQYIKIYTFDKSMAENVQFQC